MLLGWNALWILGLIGCAIFDYYSDFNHSIFSILYLLLGLPVYTVLYGMFSYGLTHKIILPQVLFWLFFNLVYFIGVLFSEEELSVIEEMAEFAVVVSILTAISTFFAVITKIIAKKTSKNVPDELACEKDTQDKENIEKPASAPGETAEGSEEKK